MASPLPIVELNGAAATADDLRHLVQTNYGHFSAMRVEDGGVRGLDLHLARIVAATRELFGAPIDHERVRSCLRHAVSGRSGPLAVRINVFSRTLNRDRLVAPVEPDILVTASSATPPRSAPLRVKSFRYTRTLAHIKHVGTFPLFHYRRLAQQAGFDDALFVDDHGDIEEGSIWNIGFFDGTNVVWPDAPQLTGVSMQLLQAGLERSGVGSTVRRIALNDIATYRGAFFTNSSVAIQPIAAIDDAAFVIDDAFYALLQRCYETSPLQIV